MPAASLLILAALSQPTFEPPTVLGGVAAPGLVEASGIAASGRNPGVLWSHNDSGDSARVFAIDTTGRHLGTYALPGIVSLDCEDAAVGPGPEPGVSYLYVGDIGDNLGLRLNVRVHRAPEPAVRLDQASQPVMGQLSGVSTITLRYPDGAKDAESLVVDPWSGDLFIISKQSAISRVYSATRAQIEGGGTITMSRVAEIPFGSATGADISRDGTLIVVRSLDTACAWVRVAGASVAEALAGACVAVPVAGRPSEPQGEAIGFAADGSGYFTVSEGAGQPLRFSRRSDTCNADINCDGVPDQGDVVCMLLSVAGERSCYCGAEPDFNGDGVPDQGDVQALILTVAGAGCP